MVVSIFWVVEVSVVMVVDVVGFVVGNRVEVRDVEVVELLPGWHSLQDGLGGPIRTRQFLSLLS